VFHHPIDRNQNKKTLLFSALKDVERILSFAVDSPIMKLVTGLEMLLTNYHGSQCSPGCVHQ
jgi:hypothetical protein